MALEYLDLLSLDPAAWVWLMVAGIIGIVSAVTVHEAGHAWSAMRLGDETARSMGRVSLDPRRHLDPFGSLLFLIAGFGWGKPTPVVAGNLRGDPRTGMGLVSIAGPIANLALAVILSIPLRSGALDWQPPFTAASIGVPSSAGQLFGDLVSYAVFFNLILAVFNLIPLVPLDGFKVVVAVLPREVAAIFNKLERYGPWPLFGLIMLDIVAPFSVIASIVVPGVNALARLAIGHPII